MNDANTHALNEYERKQDRADMIDAMWMKATEHLFNDIEKIRKEYEVLALHFKDQYSVNMDYIEDMRNAMGM